MKRFERVRMLLVEAENAKDTGLSLLLTEKARKVFNDDAGLALFIVGIVLGTFFGIALAVG